MLGISLDPVDSHAKFAAELRLPYPILADEGGDVAKRYGVFTDRYGGIASRSVFLVDEKGRLLYLDREYSLRDGSDEEALMRAVRGEAPGPESRPAGSGA